jgi:hypothetical protein
MWPMCFCFRIDLSFEFVAVVVLRADICEQWFGRSVLHALLLLWQ